MRHFRALRSSLENNAAADSLTTRSDHDADDDRYLVDDFQTERHRQHFRQTVLPIVRRSFLRAVREIDGRGGAAVRMITARDWLALEIGVGVNFGRRTLRATGWAARNDVRLLVAFKDDGWRANKKAFYRSLHSTNISEEGVSALLHEWMFGVIYATKRRARHRQTVAAR